MERIDAPRFKDGMEFAKEQIICNSMNPFDLTSYESLWSPDAEFDAGVQAFAKAYMDNPHGH